MNELGEIFNLWRGVGERIALATVIETDGSVPRGPGSKLLVTAGGKLAGSVSGGCVEGAVAEEAAAVLIDGVPRITRYGITRDMIWDVGLACGGSVDIFIQSLEHDEAPSFDDGITECTIVRGPDHVGARVSLRSRDGDAVAPDRSTGVAALDAALENRAHEFSRLKSPRVEQMHGYDVFFDPCKAPQRLIIVGAVHIAVALCAYASRAGFEVTVIDPRERLNDRERFPAAQTLAVGWPEDELPKIPIDENTYVAVLAHDEKFDDPTLDFVLRRNPRYVGAIGSRKTQAKRRARLIASNIPQIAIDALHGPIGLDIGSDTPDEIAIAILAEMIAAKYGRSGASLRDSDAKNIHV